MDNQRILLVTLSDFRGGKFNYYCKENGDYNFYCSGVAQQEPISKYVLANYKIDKIVVLCSKECIEVHTEADKAINKNARKRFGSEKEYWSEYEYYEAAITRYLNGEEEDYLDMEFRGELSDEIIAMCKKVAQKYINKDKTPPEEISEILSNVKIPDKWSLDKLRKEIPEFDEQYVADSKAFEEVTEYREKINIENYVKGKDSDEIENSLNAMADYYYSLYVECVNKKYVMADAIRNKLNEINAELVKIKTRKRDSISACIAYHKYVIKSKKTISNLDILKSYGGKIKIVPIELLKNNGQDMQNIIEEIGDGSEVYIDIQGGDRTSGYKRTAILSLLEKRNVSVEKIFSTEYLVTNEINSIKDDTKEYKITDFASGINSFIQYGKAGKLINYIKDDDRDAKYSDLIQTIQKINDVVSMGDVHEMATHIEKLNACLNEKYEDEFELLKREFEENYKDVIKDGKVNTLGLIGWCIDKDFIQQALTLVEDRMPELYFEKGIFRLENKCDEVEKTINKMGNRYEKRYQNNIICNNGLYLSAQKGMLKTLSYEMAKQLGQSISRKERIEADWEEGMGALIYRWCLSGVKKEDFEKLKDGVNRACRISNKVREESDKLLKIIGPYLREEKIIEFKDDEKNWLFKKLSAQLNYKMLREKNQEMQNYKNVLCVVGKEARKIPVFIEEDGNVVDLILDLRIAEKLENKIGDIDNNLNAYMTIRNQRNLVNHAVAPKEQDNKKWSKEECIKQLNAYIEDFENLCKTV